MLNQGHRANSVVLLVRGQARTTFTTNGGQRLLLRWLPTGEVVGLAALMPTAKDYILSTEAVKESWGLVWGRSDDSQARAASSRDLGKFLCHRFRSARRLS